MNAVTGHLEAGGEHANFISARIGRLLAMRWHGRTTRDAAEKACSLIRKNQVAHGTTALLLIHDAADPPPTPGGIRVILSFVRELRQLTHLRVALVQGGGFGAAIVHAAYGRILLISRSQSTFVDKDVNAAMTRVAPAAGMSAQDLEQQLRAQGLIGRASSSDETRSSSV